MGLPDVTTCFCGRQIADGERMHLVAIHTDWGDNDERQDASKQAVFHSFQCLADWASQLAANHDDRVVRSGNPDQPPASDEPTVDTQTDTLIRKDTP